VSNPPTARSSGISPDVLTQKIDQFLAARGFAGGAGPQVPRESFVSSVSSVSVPAAGGPAAAASPPALDFVCEEDVRLAIQAGKQLVISQRAIVTPAARDLAEAHHIFVRR
jgi:hypothetical protein